MPFYEKGDVRIRYEETGSGFPLLVTPGGGLNFAGQQLADRGVQRAGGLYERLPLHHDRSAQRQWRRVHRPIPTGDPWDAFADDQLGLMDHLGISEFFYMGYCIGGCFAGKLLSARPTVSSPPCSARPSAIGPKTLTSCTAQARTSGLPSCCRSGPTSSGAWSTVPAQPVPGAARLPLQRVARFHPQLPHADPGPAGRHAGAPAADLDRCRLAGAERRDHRVPVARPAGTEGSGRSTRCAASSRASCRCEPPRSRSRQPIRRTAECKEKRHAVLRKRRCPHPLRRGRLRLSAAGHPRRRAELDGRGPRRPTRSTRWTSSRTSTASSRPICATPMAASRPARSRSTGRGTPTPTTISG